MSGGLELLAFANHRVISLVAFTAQDGTTIETSKTVKYVIVEKLDFRLRGKATTNKATAKYPGRLKPNVDASKMQL